MPGINSLIKIGQTTGNTYTDGDLQNPIAELDIDKSIKSGTEALSKTLNAFFRQVTAVTVSLAELIADSQDANVNSSLTKSIIKTALENIAINKVNPTIALIKDAADSQKKLKFMTHAAWTALGAGRSADTLYILT